MEMKIEIKIELYRYGEGSIPADLKMAAEIAKLSADRGYFRGLVQFAEYLEKGIGVTRDLVQAKALLARAHGPEFVGDQNSYAFDVCPGKGCPVRIEEALKYYKIASDHGLGAASRNLARLLQFGKLVPKNLAEATRLFKRAIDLDDMGGYVGYARCLFEAHPDATVYRRPSHIFEKVPNWVRSIVLKILQKLI
jgi:TPR repeat protein